MAKINFIENKYIKNLVLQTQKGNVNSFHELYNLNYKNVSAVFVRLLGDGDLALKYTKNLFVLSYKNISALPKELPFSGWLFGLAVHYSLIKVRKMIQANKLGSSDKNIFSNKIAGLNKAILELDHEQRIAIVLNKVLGYSLEETADLVGKSPKDVSTLLKDAVKNLLESKTECQIGFQTIIDNVHDKSNPIFADEFKMHLQSCSNCKTFHESSKNLLIEISNLDLNFGKANDTWKTVKQELMQEERAKIEDAELGDTSLPADQTIKNATREIIIPSFNKQSLINRFIPVFSSTFFKLSIPLICFILIYFGYNYYSGFFESSDVWTAKVIKGEILLNGKLLSTDFTFYPGDVVKTQSNGELIIKTSSKRQFVLNELTEVSRSQINKNLTIEIKSGTVKIFSTDDALVFRITTPVADVYDLGSESIISIINENNILVTNHYGYVEVEKRDENSLLIEGSECKSTFNQLSIQYSIE
ncbi:MAG: hypothetical protein K8H86_02700, partial [Ignavibacteriaceae bacterium]|nr:hypothetical protein [Ignavibacteriaceae bacterium]